MSLWNRVLEGIKEENRTHAPIDFDADLPSTIISHGAGYINKDLETIVGLQTGKPLKPDMGLIKTLGALYRAFYFLTLSVPDFIQPHIFHTLGD